METTLGCGYLINDESAITDFYSPPSSFVDDNEDLFYPEDDDDDNNNEFLSNNTNDLSKQIEEPIKLMSPPSTPLNPRRLFDPTEDFQNMKIDISNNLTPTNRSLNTSLFSPMTNKTSTNLLTPTSMDRYFLEHHRLSDSIFTPTIQNGHQSISVQHTERIQINKSLSESSRLYSYLTNSNDTYINNPYMKSSSCLNQQVNPIYSNMNQSSSSIQNPWFPSDMSSILRQNNSNNIALSTTAQQILNGNSRPLRSEKIDIEVIKHLIQEANWKRQCGMKKEICVFCRNNGENELIYSSHSLKDSMGNVTCPILRAYQCPICGATGSQAHTIKYCQSTGDDQNRHLPTPYEKMLRMQTFGYDESIPSLLGQFSSPSSIYSNGWSDSYL